MAKSAKKFFLTDDAFQGLQSLLTAEYDAAYWQKVVALAAPQLEAQWERFKTTPKGEYLHLHESILPRVVMYQTLLAQFGTHKALALMEEATRIEGTQVGEVLRKLTNLPLMPPVFMKLFALMILNLFGEKNGFRLTVHTKNSRELRFDVTECPYCKYTRLLDMPALTHIFCDSDLYSYGGMDQITFHRTQTLGHGGTCCDFCLKRK